MTGTRIQLQGVEVRADDGSLILEETSLDLLPGWYGLNGSNGSGKTTLLKVLAGLVIPSRGRISYWLEGNELPGDAFKGYLGYKPQQAAYYENMTVAGYLRYVAQMKLLPKRESAERAQQLCAAFQLITAGDTVISQLSGGQKQRLMLVQALLGDPWFLLLDDLLKGVDIESRFAIVHTLYELTCGTVTVLAGDTFLGLDGWLDGEVMLADGAAAYVSRLHV